MNKTFEYKTVKIGSKGFWSAEIDADEIDKTLNEYGQQGWELISVIKQLPPNGSAWSLQYTFKRQLN